MQPGEVTQLLSRWAAGDRAALDDLTPIVYAELRRIANGYLRRERPGHTLQPTALVHEAWMRLMGQDRPSFERRNQFFALAAQVMRRILVDHARAAGAQKRGGGRPEGGLDGVAAAVAGDLDELLALDQALGRLAHMSARQAQVIELRYFGGLDLEEMAGLLGVSIATVSRDQKMAEAWLSRSMSDGAG